MTQLENTTHTDLVTLGDNQKQLEQAYKTIQTGNVVPKDVVTEPSTPPSTVTGGSAYSAKVLAIDTELKRVTNLRKHLEDLARQQQATLRTKPPTNSRSTTTTTDKWRAWKFCLHTHGANLTHNSPACTRPQSRHKQDVTKTNPMGGNTGRYHLYEQWYHPVLHTNHTSPTT